MAAARQFDLFVTAPGTDAKRRLMLSRLVALYPLDAEHDAALGRGERVLLQEKLGEAAAQKAMTDLRSLGFRVELEPRVGAPQMMELDQAAAPEPVRAPPKKPDNPFFDVSAGLVGLDGTDEPEEAPRAPTTGGGGMAGLFGATLRDEDEPLADDGVSLPAKRAAPPPVAPPKRPGPPPPPRAVTPAIPIEAPRPAPPAPALPADRFKPSGIDDSSFELALEKPVKDNDSHETFNSNAPASKSGTFEVPRCPTHDVVRKNGRCAMCDAEEQQHKGRLFGGKLHANPAVRLGLGIVCGIFIGWIATAPMARHAMMHVQEVREAAEREHKRPTEEAQAHAALLDNQADDEQQSGFMRTLAVMAVVAVVVTAVWMRMT